MVILNILNGNRRGVWFWCKVSSHLGLIIYLIIIYLYIYRLCLTLYLLINISTDTIAHTSTKPKFWNSENCCYLLDFHLMKSSRFWFISFFKFSCFLVSGIPISLILFAMYTYTMYLYYFFISSSYFFVRTYDFPLVSFWLCDIMASRVIKIKYFPTCFAFVSWVMWCLATKSAGQPQSFH